METMSKYFKLDNGKSFWQSGIYRKEQRQRNYSLPLKHLKYMNIVINFLATCKLFLQKKIERTQNEHEF